jgi:alkylation response protein AidB-like acyl-CoA dehydrogenase
VNFDLNEDELMLKALVERFVADYYVWNKRSTYTAEEQGFSAGNWEKLGEIGLIATAFSVESGGMGVSSSDLALVFEALGRGVVVEPLIDSALLAGGLFERCADDGLKAQWMDDLVSGNRRLVFAHQEHAARQNLAWVETTAQESADGWRLSGKKSLIPYGVNADGYIVSARVSGAAGDPDGIRLFLAPAGSQGLSTEAFRVIDGTVACSLSLEDVTATALNGGLVDIEDAQSKAAIARAAEALGIMEMLFETTLEYLRTRKQFGIPLGKFQALQHRMVAQYAVIEQARALLNIACINDPADRVVWRKAIAGATAFINDAAVTLGHEAIQLHGGMGVSDELIVGHGHKRLVMLSRFPETADVALDRFAG